MPRSFLAKVRIDKPGDVEKERSTGRSEENLKLELPSNHLAKIEDSRKRKKQLIWRPINLGDSEGCPYKETRDSNKEEEEERGKSYKESLKSNKELSESNKEVKELHSEKTESYQKNISPYKSIQAPCQIELEPYKEEADTCKPSKEPYKEGANEYKESKGLYKEIEQAYKENAEQNKSDRSELGVKNWLISKGPLVQSSWCHGYPNSQLATRISSSECLDTSRKCFCNYHHYYHQPERRFQADQDLSPLHQKGFISEFGHQTSSSSFTKLPEWHDGQDGVMCSKERPIYKNWRFYNPTEHFPANTERIPTNEIQDMRYHDLGLAGIARDSIRFSRYWDGLQSGETPLRIDDDHEKSDAIVAPQGRDGCMKINAAQEKNIDAAINYRSKAVPGLHLIRSGSQLSCTTFNSGQKSCLADSGGEKSLIDSVIQKSHAAFSDGAKSYTTCDGRHKLCMTDSQKAYAAYSQANPYTADSAKQKSDAIYRGRKESQVNEGGRQKSHTIYKGRQISHTRDDRIQDTRDDSEKSDENRASMLISGRPYICEVCKKSFKRRSSLATHKFIHTDLKPHTCTVCDKKFLRKSDLKKHGLMHSGKKPYRCEKCGRQFSQSSNMLTHMRRHMGIRPFTCSKCERSFFRKVDLRRHEGRHLAKKMKISKMASTASHTREKGEAIVKIT